MLNLQIVGKRSSRRFRSSVFEIDIGSVFDVEIPTSQLITSHKRRVVRATERTQVLCNAENNYPKRVGLNH